MWIWCEKLDEGKKTPLDKCQVHLTQNIGFGFMLQEWTALQEEIVLFVINVESSHWTLMVSNIHR